MSNLMTAKVLNETIDIDRVVESARDNWSKRENKRRSLEKWIVRFIPIGVVVMAIIFYSLSAPHTAGILNIITPFWGNLSPLAWELGIVIMAAMMEAGLRNALTRIVMWTLVLMSIVINIAGAFISVVEMGTGLLDGETMQQLVSRYPELPAVYQVVLILVIPIGIVIPVVAKIVGEILIKLALGKVQLQTQSDDVRWAKERTRAVYGALFQAAIKEGAGTATAGNWANAVVKHLFRESVTDDSMIEAVSDQHVKTQPSMGFSSYVAQRPEMSADGHADNRTDTRTTGHSTGQGYAKKMNAREVVQQHLSANPADADMPVRTLADKLGVGKTTVADVIREMKSQ